MYEFQVKHGGCHQGREPCPVSLYNVNKDENLDNLRLCNCRFCEKTTCSTAAVEPCNLSLTSAAAKYRSLRVYQQVQVRFGHDQKVPADQWGWKVCEGNWCQSSSITGTIRSNTVWFQNWLLHFQMHLQKKLIRLFHGLQWVSWSVFKYFTICWWYWLWGWANRGLEPCENVKKATGR